MVPQIKLQYVSMSSELWKNQNDFSKVIQNLRKYFYSRQFEAGTHRRAWLEYVNI